MLARLDTEGSSDLFDRFPASLRPREQASPMPCVLRLGRPKLEPTLDGQRRLSKHVQSMDEAAVAAYWNAHPCGEEVVGAPGMADDYGEFFDRYDAYRYSREPHILRRLDEHDWQGKQVLEIGLGLGADSEQLIRRGARWTGVDLTEESVARVQARLDVRGLPFEDLRVASARELPFNDNQFDVVFSFGVLHHIPDIDSAQREIARVLKEDGVLVAMLYAKRSLYYLASVAVYRRLAIAGLYAVRAKPGGNVGEHLRLAGEQGLGRYLKLSNFIHHNTDGPLNPYTKVYSVSDVRNDFSCFRLVASYQDFMHAPPFPVRKLPLSSWLGWHLWVYLTPRADL